MSCQETIDLNYKTEKGRFLHSFTVIGESGPANVPKDVHVRFYGCSISSLTLNGNNNIFLEGGTCSSVNGDSSLLAARGTSFSGDVSLTNSKVDLYSITSSGQWKMQSRSHLRSDNSKFSGGNIAGEFSGGSQGRYTRCTFSGHGTAVIKASGGSFVLLSKCSSVKGVKALWALDRSIIQAVECPEIQGTSTYALHAEDYARIEALNCALVKGQVNAGFGDSHGFIVCNKCKEITGNSDSAIFLDNHAGAEIRSFQLLHGQGNSAVRGVNLNSIFVIGGQTIKSDAKHGIELLNGGHGHVVSVQNILGVGTNGIHLDQTSELYVNDVITVKGSGAHGVFAGNQSMLQLYEVVNVEGAGGSGAYIDTKSRFATFFVENILGDGADGVTLGVEAYAAIQGAAQVAGQAGHGVRMDTKAQIILSACQAVIGQGGDGINAATACKITVSKGTAITGAAGNGITAGTGSTVNVVKTATVTGARGDGVKATGSLVKFRKVETVAGASGDGFNLTNTDLEAVLCPSITGAVNGISSSGEGVEKTRLKLDRCVSVYGATSGLNLTQTLVESRGSVYSGGHSLLSMSSHIRTVKDIFDGDMTLDEDSIFEQWNSTVTGILTATGGAVVGVLGSTSSADITSGALLSVGFVLGNVTSDASYFALVGGSASVSGNGGVVSLGAGEPISGISFLDVEVPSAKVQDQVGDYAFYNDAAINVSSTGLISEEAQTSVAIAAQTSVDIEAQTSASLKGNTTLSLEGNSSISVTTSGSLTGSATLYDWQ